MKVGWELLSGSTSSRWEVGRERNGDSLKCLKRNESRIYILIAEILLKIYLCIHNMYMHKLSLPNLYSPLFLMEEK
jgi:hypothetical protein